MINRIFVCVGLASLTLFLPPCQNEGNPEGVSNPGMSNIGLKDYSVPSICISGNNLVAGTVGGAVFLSTDDGLTWRPVDTLHSVNSVPGANFSIDTRVTLYNSGSYIFAGANALEGSIDVSADNGLTWEEKDSSFDQNVSDFTSIGNNVFAGTNNGVYLSTDYGTSWEPVNNGPLFSSSETTYGHAPQVWTLMAVGSELFAGTPGEGILESSDYGMDWAQADNGLNNVGVFGLASIGTVVFAASFSDDSTGGVFISVNNGSSWQPAYAGLTNHMINFLYADGSVLFAGSNTCIFRSTDYGASWTVLDSLSVGSLVSDGPTLLAGTGNGIVRISP